MTPVPRVVVVTGADLALARSVAAERAAAGAVAVGQGVRLGSYTPEDIEVVGMLAEVVACRHYGVAPDLETGGPRAAHGADLAVGGFTANVKGTLYFPTRRFVPNLLVRDHDTRYDAYILVSVDPTGRRPYGLIHGYATRARVAAAEPRPFREGSTIPSRVVPWGELRSCRTSEEAA